MSNLQFSHSTSDICVSMIVKFFKPQFFVCIIVDFSFDSWEMFSVLMTDSTNLDSLGAFF